MAYHPDEPRGPDGKWSSGLMHSLEHQLKAKGTPPEKVHELAVEIMANQGTLDPKTGLLTAKGQEREDMGRRARRIDRVAKQTGHKPENIAYKGGKAFVK